MFKAVRGIVFVVLLCISGSVFAQVETTPIAAISLSTTGQANIRECPQTTCAVVAKVAKNTPLTATATAQGEIVKKNNPLWYQVTLADGRTGFAYSGVVKVVATTAVAAPVSVPQTEAPAVAAEPAAVVQQAAAPAMAYDPFGSDRDCGDFGTHAEAQAFFVAAGGPASDPHRLDADNDAIACESLP